jgi:NADH-quinone oxidoreductase subunit L
MEPKELLPIAVQHVSLMWLIPVFPLIGALLNVSIGWKLQRLFGKRVVHGIAIGAMLASFVTAVCFFWQLRGLDEGSRFLQNTLWNAFSAGPVTVDLGFALDPLSMMMVLIITFIGTLIHVFSVGYMADEPSYWRFFAYLNLFVFSMLLLVMGDNFVVMFFGWEGVGLCSYLLIAFWFTDSEKAAAGMKAFVVNRVGDFGFTAGLLLLFWSLGGAWQASHANLSWVPSAPAAQAQMVQKAEHGAEAGAAAKPEAPEAPGASRMGEAKAEVREAGAPIKIGPTLNFRELRDQIVLPHTGVAKHLQDGRIWGFGLVAVICILLFVGAMGKSAQIPLYVWLPDAMAGPTPVSALIHAATMVTAGVYMVARLNFLFVLSPTAMGWVALVGALTALFAASIGFFQYDIKKVLAYSTVSQLGFMFIGVGVGSYWAGSYHLLTHAFFKATLFLAAGSVILGCHHEQDMRKMGGLSKHMPWTRRAYLAATWAIAGFPWASGFFSKDEILWKAFTSRHLSLLGLHAPWLGPAIYVAGIVAATGTAFYMFRSYYMTFTGSYRGGEGHDAHGGHGHDTHGHHGGTPHESPLSVTFVLTVLGAGAVLAAVLGIPAIWSGHEPILEAWLAPALTAEVHFAESSHAMEWLFQGLGVGAGVLGWFFARMLYKDAQSKVPAQLKERFLGVWTVIYNKYYVDELYQAGVIRPSVALARALSWFDLHIIDGLVNLVGAIGRTLGAIDAAIDTYLVDGAVNLVARLTMAGGRSLRRVQTGRIQTYLYGALFGALLIVALNFIL